MYIYVHICVYIPVPPAPQTRRAEEGAAEGGRVCCLSSCCARSMPACLRGGACHRSRAREAACLPTSWPSPCPILSYVCAHRPIAGMLRPVGTDRRPKGPPCKVPTCPDPENASGHWTYLPADFLLSHPELDKQGRLLLPQAWLQT